MLAGGCARRRPDLLLAGLGALLFELSLLSFELLLPCAKLALERPLLLLLGAIEFLCWLLLLLVELLLCRLDDAATCLLARVLLGLRRRRLRLPIGRLPLPPRPRSFCRSGYRVSCLPARGFPRVLLGSELAGCDSCRRAELRPRIQLAWSSATAVRIE